MNVKLHWMVAIVRFSRWFHSTGLWSDMYIEGNSKELFTPFLLHAASVKCYKNIQRHSMTNILDEKAPKWCRSEEYQATVWTTFSSFVENNLSDEIAQVMLSWQLRHYRTTQGRVLHPKVWLLEPLGDWKVSLKGAERAILETKFQALKILHVLHVRR